MVVYTHEEFMKMIEEKKNPSPEKVKTKKENKKDGNKRNSKA